MPTCLRCPTPLTETGGAGDLVFLACPACGRRYALDVDGVLTERWAGSLGVALYGVIFTAQPNDPAEAARVAAQLGHLDTAAIVREIRLELEQPTQPVSRILPGMRAGEEELRGFLALLADELSP